MGASFLWFRAFNREGAEALLEVLCHGDTPNPNPECTTRKNEEVLGIAPPHVYAYLGKTLPSFGRFAISLHSSSPTDLAPSGQVSPFDTGGLVEHLRPIRDWDATAKRKYLEQHSWDHEGVSPLLDAWPGHTNSSVAAYLDGDRPTESGPHEALASVVAELPDVQLWVNNGDWRAWIWELRVPDRLPTDTLAYWTCPPDVFPDVVRLGERRPSLKPRIVEMIPRYIPGGLGQLIASLRDKQANA